MPSYTFNEGSLELPSLVTDRSINILVLRDSTMGDPTTLVINRDVFEPGETLEVCVKRQLALLARQMRGIVEVRREPVSVGVTEIPGMLVELHATQAEGKTYQWQVIFPVNEKDLIIYGFTTVKPFNDQHRKTLDAILASYTPPEVESS